MTKQTVFKAMISDDYNSDKAEFSVFEDAITWMKDMMAEYDGREVDHMWGEKYRMVGEWETPDGEGLQIVGVITDESY